MSSSTSSSNDLRFFGWVLAAFVASAIVINALPQGEIPMLRRMHRTAMSVLGPHIDFLVLGDSRAGPFRGLCMTLWSNGYRGLGLTANSVTPIFHYDNLRAVRASHPEFAPKVVFVVVGPNNFNANGLHVRRSHTLLNDLDLATVWDLSAGQGEYLSFVDVILARLVPIYGKRVSITHLDFQREKDDPWQDLTLDEHYDARCTDRTPAKRDPIDDRNYLDIYRRSMYPDYRESPLVRRALEKLIELVRSFGGAPVMVSTPIAPEMYALQRQMVGDQFDNGMREITEKYGLEFLDLRQEERYELADVNHLSENGARDVVVEVFTPVLDEVMSREARALAGRPAGTGVLRHQAAASEIR